MSLQDMLGKGKNSKAAVTEVAVVEEALAPAKPALTGLALALEKSKAAKAAQATKPKPTTVAQPTKQGKPIVPAEPDTLADLGSLMMDTAVAVVPDTNVDNYKYQEQADACDDATTATFYELMHTIVNSFGTDKLGEALHDCRGYLQEHDHLKAILKPEDIHYMVRGLRSTYGSALASRTANKTKRSASNKKVDDVLADLGSLSF